jgi:uncharacterized membrane protein
MIAKGVTMFGRNGAQTAVADAASELSGYGTKLVEDEKLRERLMAAIVAGAAARRRARRQAGMRGHVRRLAADPVLRGQLTEMVVQLQKARQRVEKRRSHKVRNSILVLAGFGAASAAVSLPSVRQRLLGVVGDLTDRGRAVATATGPTKVDDTRLHWVAKVGGKRAEWDAKILFQEPDRRISWQSEDGKQTRGTVTFEEIGPTSTRVRLEMTYLPEGVREQAGSTLGLDRRRIRGDLQRFKHQLEQQGTESGGWRGKIEAGQKASSGTRS